MAIKIYLDICCLKRPFDDQTQGRIHLESEAVLKIVARIDSGKYSLMGSEILDLENARDPDLQRRDKVEKILARAAVRIQLTDGSHKRGRELAEKAFKPLDALHISSAEQAEADVFISCDDHLLSNAKRNADIIEMHILNPIEFIRNFDNDQ